MITQEIRNKLTTARIMQRADDNTYVAWWDDGFGLWVSGVGRRQWIDGLTEHEVNELRYPKE